MRLLHAALFALAARGDPALARAVLSLVVSLIPGAGLIIIASTVVDEGTTRDMLWLLAAVVLDYGLVLVRGVEGWHVHAKHFAERFALVLIIALGESIVAIGVGAAGVELGAAEVVAALLAIGIACALWWAYFDVVAVVAEHRFTSAVGLAQLKIARDSYALLHLPMIAGIVLFALGVKKVLEHTGDPLKDMPAVALCGGLALYLLAHVAFRLRNTGTVGWRRIVAAAVCLALIPVATRGLRRGDAGDPARGVDRADRLRGDARRRGASPHQGRADRALRPQIVGRRRSRHEVEVAARGSRDRNARARGGRVRERGGRELRQRRASRARGRSRSGSSSRSPASTPRSART